MVLLVVKNKISINNVEGEKKTENKIMSQHQVPTVKEIEED